MTFEDAWPEIKEGKEWRMRYGNDPFSDWYKNQNPLLNMNFELISKTEFQIKPEPRELSLVFENGKFKHVVYNSNLDVEKFNTETIKVREVID